KKVIILTPSNSSDNNAALSTSSIALGNIFLGEIPSNIGLGIKRSAEEANPDAILFEETPTKKKPAPRKRLTTALNILLAANKAEMAAATIILATTVNEPVTTGDSIYITTDSFSYIEEAIADTLTADADKASILTKII
ncbi:hypothetical protein QBC45DRAFT_315948, partial [Copromyces sp. CBS 386.78]